MTICYKSQLSWQFFAGNFELYEVAKPYVTPFFQTCNEICELLMVWLFLWLNRVRFILVVLWDKPKAEKWVIPPFHRCQESINNAHYHHLYSICSKFNICCKLHELFQIRDIIKTSSSTARTWLWLSRWWIMICLLWWTDIIHVHTWLSVFALKQNSDQKILVLHTNIHGFHTSSFLAGLYMFCVSET